MIKFGYMDFIINMQKIYACDCVTGQTVAMEARCGPHISITGVLGRTNSALNC